MHILILTISSDAREKVQAALDDTADRYTIATAWSDVVAHLQEDRPDVILIERTALNQVELVTLVSLLEPGRWPPLLIVDASDVGARAGIAVTQRLTQTRPHYYQVGELRIDTRRKRAKIGERWVTLPPIQYRLLLALADRVGEVIDCQELLRAVWGYDGEENEARELVKVHIRQIRRRLGLDAEEYSYIHSVRGFGYMLAAPGDD
jgi:DNA-binding response OmpR family regulator